MILFFIVGKLHATHIVGGELNYQYLGNNDYKITLKLYIDCVNGQPAAIAQDEFANIGIFAGSNDSLLLNLSFDFKRNPPIRVSKTNYDCITISPNACVDAYYYEKTVNLPYRVGGYTLSFQRCCRNNTILNLINPESTGANFFTKIADTTGFGYNSSPFFKNLPPNFLCTNAPLVFDHSATDADGDSLVYEFFHPFLAATAVQPRPNIVDFQTPPFTNVVYVGGYSPTMAINSMPNISINKQTGVLKITPTLAGQFVVGIVVKEYRNGKLIGYTQRDYQFNVQDCVFETTSAFATPEINCDREVVFTNNSSNATKYFWDYGDSTKTNDTSILKNGYYKYPNAGKYTIKLIASKGNCVDSIVQQIEILDNIKYQLPNDTFMCTASNLKIAPNKFYKNAQYIWNTGSTDSFILVSNQGQYWVNVTYGKCMKADTFNLSLDNQDVKLAASELTCNKNTKTIEGYCIAKGNFANVQWQSNPQQIPTNNTDSIAIITKSGMVAIFGLKKNGCPYSDSIEINAITDYGIFKVGNVFTPNGDSYNNVFPEQNPPYFYTLQIFNRWGIKVHSAENIPWSGDNMPDGVYYYFIKATACGLENETHGVVHIVR